MIGFKERPIEAKGRIDTTIRGEKGGGKEGEVK